MRIRCPPVAVSQSKLPSSHLISPLPKPRKMIKQKRRRYIATVITASSDRFSLLMFASTCSKLFATASAKLHTPGTSTSCWVYDIPWQFRPSAPHAAAQNRAFPSSPQLRPTSAVVKPSRVQCLDVTAQVRGYSVNTGDATDPVGGWLENEG